MKTKPGNDAAQGGATTTLEHPVLAGGRRSGLRWQLKLNNVSTGSKWDEMFVINKSILFPDPTSLPPIYFSIYLSIYLPAAEAASWPSSGSAIQSFGRRSSSERGARRLALPRCVTMNRSQFSHKAHLVEGKEA